MYFASHIFEHLSFKARMMAQMEMQELQMQAQQAQMLAQTGAMDPMMAQQQMQQAQMLSQNKWKIELHKYNLAYSRINEVFRHLKVSKTLLLK